MSQEIIRDALRTTFHDYRLTRGEKKGLSRLLAEQAGRQSDRDFIRTESLQLVRDTISESSQAEQKMMFSWLDEVTKLLIHLEREQITSVAQNEVYFSPQDPCVHRIQKLFGQAKKSADICVFTITDDRIRREIIAAHERGISVKILSDDDKSGDLGSDVNYLRRKGIEVRLDQSSYHMHHKFAIFDQAILLSGSYNWTRSAAEHNEENFLITRDKKLCVEYQREFDRLWNLYG